MPSSNVDLDLSQAVDLRYVVAGSTSFPSVYWCGTSVGYLLGSSSIAELSALTT